MSDNTVRILPAKSKISVSEIEALMKGSSADQAKAIKMMQEIKRNTVEEEIKNKVSKPRGKGVGTAIETVVFTNPNLKGKELYDAVKAKGIDSTPTTIDSYRSACRHSLRTLHSLGYLSEKGIAAVNKI